MLKIKAGKNRNAGLYRSWTHEICDIFLVRCFGVYYYWIILLVVSYMYFDNLIGWVKIQTMMCIPLKQITQEWPTCQTGFFTPQKRTFQITTCYIAQYLWLILVLFILCLVQLENKCVWSLIIGPKYIAWRNNWDKFNPWVHQLAFGHTNCLFRSVSVLIFPNES